MPAPLFEFFEVVAEELSATDSRVITREDLQPKDKESALLNALKNKMGVSTTEEAIALAVKSLEKHFASKGAKLPFEYDPKIGRFTATDRSFLDFVREMSEIRSIGTRSRDFECRVATWLGKRATGAIHRVGHPRDVKKKSEAFNAHLRGLGFDRPVLLGKDKDGGFDIIWLLPLGTIPHRPMVSVQCKNGVFNMEAADASVGAGSRSFSQHAGLQPQIHVPCVLFNDYLSPETLTAKQMNYVPLGLSDLAGMEQLISVELI